jgi:hypothetical protein
MVFGLTLVLALILGVRLEGIAWRATCPSPTAGGHLTSTFG